MNQTMYSSARSKGTRSLFRIFALAVVAAISLVAATNTHAINASPNPVNLVQPDGTRITLRPKGDEFTHWFEDMNGFTVVRDGKRFAYAQRRANGSLEPTAFSVGRDNPRALNLPEKLRPSPQFIIGERQKSQTQNSPTGPAARINPVGTVRNLVILCRFSDHTLGVHTRPPADYELLLNAVGGNPAVAPTGSLRDYYLEASYGTLTLDSTVIAWVTLPQTEAYYANGVTGFGFYPQNGQGMVKDALDLVDPLVNFSQFDTDNDGFVDAIDIIHSGYGAETGGGFGNWIWSHKWSLIGIPGGRWTSGDRNGNNVSVKVFDYHTEPALFGVSGTEMLRVGVLAHETGHFFGLPDLYDTDGGGEGAGSYCLMANSWGFDGTQLYPPHPSAWAKIELGWVTPITIAPGTYNAPRVETSRTIYRITNGYPNGEYMLIENRQPVGFEAGMPQGGLAIWQIDNDQDGNDNSGFPDGLGWPTNHYRVALLQADGAYHLERGTNRGDAFDVYRGGGGISSITATTVPNTHGYQSGSFVPTANQIINISSSASNMTFTFVNTNATPPPSARIVAVDATLATESYTPTNRAIDPGENVSVTFRLRNTGNSNANVTATLLTTNGVLSPGAAQVYSLNANGAAVGKTYAFTAGGQCGATITNVLQLQIGSSNIGTVSFTFSLGGQPTRLGQNFESITPPALPTNWQTTVGGWSTLTAVFTTPSKFAFVADSDTVSDHSLTSPAFVVSSTNAQLSFSHRHATEYGFDGGVLEISFNNGPFTDILAAGGRFGANGYNFFIDGSFGNPLANRDAWTGDSTNLLVTTVTLPASASGKSVRLRWRLGSDSAVGSTGWYVDGILVTERACNYPAGLPVIANARHEGTNVVFSFNTRNGIHYGVEYKNSLSDLLWTPFPVLPGNGAMQSITNDIGSAPQRFFRLREL